MRESRPGGYEAFWTGPTVAGDTVFVGIGPKFADSGTGGVHAFDAESGEERWPFETGARVNSSPTVVDGVVYFGSDDSSVYAVEAGVEESSEGSRVLLGTLGHHDNFRYAVANDGEGSGDEGVDSEEDGQGNETGDE